VGLALKFLKHYGSVFLGVIVGAIVATMTTMVIYGDLPGHEVEALQKCLAEYATSHR
jgi:hypothetical protein